MQRSTASASSLPWASAAKPLPAAEVLATAAAVANSSMSGDTGEEEDRLASINSLILTGALLVLVAIGYRINTHRLRNVPESGVAIMLGFALGLVVRLLHFSEEERLLDFKGEFFFYVLLPPIIFEAGLSLETQMFVDNLGAICTFAVVGTLVSTWVVGAGLHHAAKAGLIGLSITPRLGIQCQLFGALISATDPVATIALFGSSRFRADPLLHALINGESVLNDAVAIVLFSTLSHHLDEEEPTLVSFSVLGHFFMVSAGSLVVGLVAGVACSWSFCQSKYLRRFPDYEISAMCLSAYITFAFSQLVGLSGIVALFFFGVILANYNWYNLSEPSKVASKVTFGTLAKIAESCVFLYLGIMAAFAMGRFHWHFKLVLYASLVIVLARAAHIFPLTVLLNFGRRRKKIDRNMTFMMWISGMRGAIAFALSLRIPCVSTRLGQRGSDECQNTELLITTTISIVVLTTLVVGALIEHVATSLRLIEPSSSPMPGDYESQSLSVPFASREVSEESSMGQSMRHEPFMAGDKASLDGSVGTGPAQFSSVDIFGSGLQRLPDSARSLWALRYNARGHLYRAFARFDLEHLQPTLGGPCCVRSTVVRSAGLGTTEMANLQGFAEQPGWPRHITPPAEDEAPAWSRSFVFE